MKHYSILFCAALMAVIGGCSTKTVNEYKEVEAMHASDMYDGDSVFSYLQRHNDQYADIAKNYMERSKKEEQGNIDKAIYFCKRAITLHPALETYKTLAELLSRAKQYREMQDAYALLAMEQYIPANKGGDSHDYIFGKPDEETYAQYLIAELLANNSLYGGNVQHAEELGFSLPKLKERIFSDERVKQRIDLSEKLGQDVLILFMSPEEYAAYQALPSTYKTFLSSIPQTVPVFEIDKDKVHQFVYRNYEEDELDGDEGASGNTSNIGASFLQETREDPDRWYQYNFNHVITINDSINAVVYAIDSSETACPIEMRHIYHRLVTYNPKAKIVDSKIVALQSGERLLTASFNNDKVTTTEYKRNWKKPYNKSDFDNYIVSTDKVGEKNYQITPSGKIEEVN